MFIRYVLDVIQNNIQIDTQCTKTPHGTAKPKIHNKYTFTLP